MGFRGWWWLSEELPKELDGDAEFFHATVQPEGLQGLAHGLVCWPALLALLDLLAGTGLVVVLGQQALTAS